MKKLNRTFFLTSCLVASFAFGMETTIFCQHDKKAPPPFNEFTVSANRVIIYNNASDYVEKIGFGAGVYRFWFESKRVNLIAGVSYNNYSMFKKYGTVSSDPPAEYLSDIRYRLHNLSFPVAVRFNVGKSVKFFTELGIFLNYNFYESKKGTKDSKLVKHTSAPADLFFDTGGTAGIGLKIPLKKNGLIIKTYYHQSIWKTGVINLSFGYQLL